MLDVRRIEAATPAGRDRGVDALRAVAIVGVVLGHWLVSAWERNPHLVISSPLAYMPQLSPVSWVLQTLAVFFLVGGYAAARGVREPYRSWVVARLVRLALPVVPLLLAWAALGALVSVLNGQPVASVVALAKPALGPLWFLGVFAALTALTPWLVRAGPVAVGAAVTVVAAVDLLRFGLGAPAAVGWVNLAAAWLVPYLLGVLWARGDLCPRRVGPWLLAGGGAAAIALVAWGGYPAAMIGITGQSASNLSPPTLAAVCFGLAQAGLALLLHGPLSRLMRRPRLWAPVAVANLGAMSIFLWHQTALVVTVLAFGLYGRPDTPSWVLERLAWLPVVALALVFMTWCRHRLDAGRRFW
ncbi:acyltransferase family protein [Nonomuraea mangrovi]|uniref:Acyltransferase family protein n=1 Tax=Nonomuraea mangrovi TaxID=2316207 RepID=A0ABW4SR64_9ACTN